MAKRIILNLGCGNVRKEGMINCDINPNSAADKLFDFEKRWPFKDSSVDGVYAHYLVEHIENPYRFFEEVWRICKDGALIEIHVPHAIHHAALSHPDHKHTFTYACFDWLTRPESGSDSYTKRPIRFRYVNRRFMYADCNQKKRTLLIRLIDWFSNRFPFKYERVFAYWVGGSEEIIFVLEVVKK